MVCLLFFMWASYNIYCRLLTIDIVQGLSISKMDTKSPSTNKFHFPPSPNHWNTVETCKRTVFYLSINCCCPGQTRPGFFINYLRIIWGFGNLTPKTFFKFETFSASDPTRSMPLNPDGCWWSDTLILRTSVEVGLS